MTKLAPLIFAIALLLLISGDAYACRCWKPSVETSFKGAATRIFSGEVVKLDFFRATLKVEGVWKGKPIEEVVMLTGTTKSADGYYVSSSCDYGYVLGEKYLIYAYGPDTELETSECSRTKELKYAADDIKQLDKLKQAKHKQ
ncbi:MAG: hypothetical protein ACJ741_05135 [Pyrinomonadaceae bacterium]